MCSHAGHNLALAHHDPRGWRTGPRATSAGSGSTPLRARMSALAEALESGTAAISRATSRWSARAAVRLGAEAVHPDTVQLFAAEQFTDRGRGTASTAPSSADSRTLRRGPRQDQVDWWRCSPGAGAGCCLLTPAYFGASASRGRPVLRPRHLQRRSRGLQPRGRGAPGVPGTGRAGRHSPVVVQIRLRRPGVDLDSFEDPWIAELRTVHASLHRAVWALDLTADLSIPRSSRSRAVRTRPRRTRHPRLRRALPIPGSRCLRSTS